MVNRTAGGFTTGVLSAVRVFRKKGFVGSDFPARGFGYAWLHLC